jgi:hypothetical protein
MGLSHAPAGKCRTRRDRRRLGKRRRKTLRSEHQPRRREQCLAHDAHRQQMQAARCGEGLELVWHRIHRFRLQFSLLAFSGIILLGC